MSDDLLRRIEIRPGVCGGRPVLRGRRLAVDHVLALLAAGDTVETLLAAYDDLERDDVLACMAYAAKLVAGEDVEPTPVPDAA